MPGRDEILIVDKKITLKRGLLATLAGDYFVHFECCSIEPVAFFLPDYDEAKRRGNFFLYSILF